MFIKSVVHPQKTSKSSMAFDTKFDVKNLSNFYLNRCIIQNYIKAI